MVYEDYLEEMDKLTKELIKPETEDNFEGCEDEEYYHIKMDNILVNFLKDMGYEEMVDKYEKARKHFWYS